MNTYSDALDLTMGTGKQFLTENAASNFFKNAIVVFRQKCMDITV